MLHIVCFTLQAVAAYGCLGTTVAIKTIEGNSSSESAPPALMAGLSDVEHADEVTGSVDSLWSATGEASFVGVTAGLIDLFIACSGCVWCEAAASQRYQALSAPCW